MSDKREMTATEVALREALAQIAPSLAQEELPMLWCVAIRRAA